jgi:small subunit ribosomal protein S2e
MSDSVKNATKKSMELLKVPGQKCHKEVYGAIKGANTDTKLNISPVRKGYWSNKIGKPHTVPSKVTGKGGSVKSD